MKELGMNIMIFLNTLGGSVDPKFSDEAPLVETIKIEIKELQRKIQWVDATDEDYASKYVRIEKLSKDIVKKKEQLKNMEKRAKLKQKWALEDSLEIRKKYPPIKLDSDSTQTKSQEI
jgi:hypothetical protein